MASFSRTPAFASSLPLSNIARPAQRAQASTSRRAPMCAASIILAPGQGAQALNMGRSWRDASPAAARVFEAADAALGDTLGAPLSSLIDSAADDGAATLSRTDVAQPAIFVTSMACWAGMQDLGLADPANLAVTAGLSLGEYTALAVAGAVSFDDALRLVTLRGRAMQDAAEASDGGMVALIGASDEVAQEVVDAAKGSDVLVAANFNAPGQVVLSGSTIAVDRAAKFAEEERKLRVAKLDVAGAFHSPLMQPAAERLAEALKETDIRLPNVPVMSNVSGEPHVVGSIRDMLVKQLTNPVRWAKCCEYIKAQEGYADATWTELAPGKTLSGIMRKINRKTKVTNYSEAPAPAEV